MNMYRYPADRNPAQPLDGARALSDLCGLKDGVRMRAVTARPGER